MPPMPPMGPGGRKPGGPHGARLTMEKPKDAKNTLKKLIGYIGRNRYLFFALIGLMLIITLLNLAAPSIQQIAIDCITLTKKKTSVDFGALGKTLIGLGAVYLLFSPICREYSLQSFHSTQLRPCVKTCSQAL